MKDIKLKEVKNRFIAFFEIDNSTIEVYKNKLSNEFEFTITKIESREGTIVRFEVAGGSRIKNLEVINCYLRANYNAQIVE